MLIAAVEKPVYRSDLRMFLGAWYFTLKRRAEMLCGGVKYAKANESELRCTHEIFTHSTPLLRKLKDVDMYLQYNKIVNLKLAAKRLNNVVLYPNETFSFWRLVGKPSRLKGYKKGMVLRNGSFTAGTGGGLCQMSNLIYWSAIHTPLTITERHRHGYDVFPDSNRTQPFGSGATCAYNYIDLQIKNETNTIYKLIVNVTDNDLIGAWLADKEPRHRYEVYEKSHLMRAEFWGGYTRHNLIHRRKLGMDGKLLADEYVAENHAVMMYSPFLECWGSAPNPAGLCPDPPGSAQTRNFLKKIE